MQVDNSDGEGVNSSETTSKVQTNEQAKSPGYLRLIARDLKVELGSLKEGWRYALSYENR